MTPIEGAPAAAGQAGQPKFIFRIWIYHLAGRQLHIPTCYAVVHLYFF
jgi:hypothetical protein